MNRDELIKKIAEELKGKVIERGWSWRLEYQVKETLKSYFDETDYKYVIVEKWKHGNILNIRYKNHYLFGLRYTKEKGKWHSGYWEDYYEWTFKDITCADQDEDFDLERKMYEIEIALIDSEEAKQKRFAEMLGYYNQIKDLFGDRTDSIIDYIHNHQFSIRRGSLE